MRIAIEAQVERFAPGFRDITLPRHAFSAPEREAHDPNLVDGDIAGGTEGLRQRFFRPVVRLDPYATPARGIFICSLDAARRRRPRHVRTPRRAPRAGLACLTRGECAQRVESARRLHSQ